MTLFDLPSYTVSPASLEAWAHVLETLAEREWQILTGVYHYLRETGHEDVTGGELAAFLGLDKCSVRPRITGLSERTPPLLEYGAIRQSRAKGETRCCGVRPTLPLEAIERARREM